ncbi:NF038129 family PEP-CTERM protein [Pelagicoccus sp. SDUM812003]|uniref:NF038129 family PEP-CTERM protein n=1 Tax=Pelagicoccus sp. SDUM812003 TaxID=3041267 RepID=UPI0028102365|nr:NF038129 family PEP-CTERM protein [Pelagicoccus sp. SDUM812003]MDQ8202189.1 NF038129 family PEP-CTERM protein [Pelagicoccus sp. SDUM812003]
MKRTTMKTIRLLAAAASALGLSCIGNAITTYSVSLDTSSLQGSASAPFYLDFLLLDGTAADLGNNSATISNLQFGGSGHTVGSPTVFSGASATSAGIELVDILLPFGSFYQVYQEFVPGSSLSFLLTLSDNLNSDGSTDMFSFSILDGSLFPIWTQAPDFSDNLLQITLDGDHPQIDTFAGDFEYSDVGAPSVSTVPDSSVFCIGLASLIAMFATRRRLDHHLVS